MEYYFPDHILAHIISFAESIPIDTKLVFGVPPKILIVEKELHTKLTTICLRRISFYKSGKTKESNKLPQIFEHVSMKLDRFIFWIAYHDYHGDMGYRVIKIPKSSYYSNTNIPLDYSYYSTCLYDLNSGLLMKSK
jgi:hypothetical protein